MSTTKLSNFVGGPTSSPKSGATSPRCSTRAPGEPNFEAPVSGAADVDAAMAAAAAAFPGWRDATPSERSLALFRIADAIEARAEELVAVESANTGKPLAVTLSEEIPPMVDQIRFFAGAARHLEGKSAGEYLADHTSMIRREPIGVCAAVTPWNYPAMMAVWKWAPAIAAGNAMVLKPSDTTPASTLLMAEIMSEFLPDGVFNVVCGDRDTGRMLVEHPTPAMVSITGSVRAGMQVAESASHDVKRVHLELGGKAPVVVFDDADLEAAAEGIAVAGYFNAGQDCTAATRVLAAPGVYDDFVAALAEQARAQTVGGTDVADADYGPLNSAAQLERLGGFFDRLPAHAEVVTGGTPVGRAGLLLRPVGHRRPAPGRRGDPGGAVRPGHHRPALQRRGRGASPGPTGSATGWPRACGPRTTAGPCAWPRPSTSAACGSTPTSRSWPRCPTAGSSTRATARTCRRTGSRTTPGSST